MRAISTNYQNFLPIRFSMLSPSLQFRLFSNEKDDNNKKYNPFESSDSFERHLFGDVGGNTSSGSFFHKLDKIEKSRERSTNGWVDNVDDNSRVKGGQNAGFDTLSDGMDFKLKKAANYFPFTNEILQDDYHFRPDVTFAPGMTYTPKDLDLTKPGIPKKSNRIEFSTTTAEVLKKADFRNVRFLANFLTEAGIIIKRSQTKISAKAQRKVAREIKTARAFGLMPFTTMGTKPFIFGKTMKDEDEEFEYDVHRDIAPDVVEG